MRPMLLVLKPGLYMKGTGSIACLNRLFEPARQSNSKQGSPAEPLILHNMHDLGGSIMSRTFGRVNGEPF